MYALTHDGMVAACMFCAFIGWLICQGEHEIDQMGRHAWCRWCSAPFRVGADGRPVVLN